MICKECNLEMARREPSQTYLDLIELEYKCLKCGKIVNIKKAYNADDNDIITVRYSMEKNKKLSKSMKLALNKMEIFCKDGRWRSSYELHVSLNTLRALKHRGLVESFSKFGALFYPQSNIFWRPIKKDF